MIEGLDKLLIGGQWIDSSGGETFEVQNPADGSTLTRVAKGNAQDVDRRLMFYRERFNIPYETRNPHLAATAS